MPDMNEKRFGCGIASVSGKIYVVIGCVRRYHASCEMFDPDTKMSGPQFRV